MPRFETRSDEIEIMDDLDCQGEVVDQTLRELETINALLGGNYVTINGIQNLLKTNNFPPRVSIADLGCGSGDILKLISRRASRYKAKLQLTGIDANANIIKFAVQNTPNTFNIRYEAVDILSDDFKSRKFDIIIGTLFFHHFSSHQLADLLGQLKHQARIGIVINDIHRHWLAYYSIKMLTKLFSRSAMVKFDAPLSVLRAFRKHELLEILKNAGIQNFSIRWMWAFRWQVVIHS
jgi:2-polyprenyl-3-methyl-5-hydroxy-6-metoxy-1,4-benzoquinol methylase